MDGFERDGHCLASVLFAAVVAAAVVAAAAVAGVVIVGRPSTDLLAGLQLDSDLER